MRGKANILRFKIVVLIGFLLVGPSLLAQKSKGKNKNPLADKQKQLATEAYIDGVKFLMLEDDDKALRFFKRSLQFDNENVATHHQVAQLFQRAYSYELALPHAKYAYENDKSNEYYYLSLANVYASLGKNKDAIKVYERLIKNFSKNEEYLFDLADLYDRAGQVDKSIDILDEFTKEYGVFEEIVLYKQNFYLKQNKVKEAVAEGQSLIDAHPDEDRYAIGQAKLLMANGMTDEAKELLLTYSEKTNPNPTILLLLSDIQAGMGEKEESEKNYLKAFDDPSLSFDKKIDLLALQTRRLYQTSGIGSDFKNSPRANTTKKMCESIIEQFPEESKSHAINGDFYNLIGEKETARNHYKKSLTIDDSDFKVWEQAILLDAELEQYDSLIKDSEQALELFPNQGVIWYFNGSAHLVRKNYKKSVFGFEKAKKLSRSNIQLLTDINAQLGDAYNALGQHEESDLAYEEVLEVNPNNEHVLNNYSYYLSLRNEQLEKAYEMSKKTIVRRPNNPTYIDTHAWVLYKMKRYQEAQELMEKIVEDSESSEVIEHYGDILFQNGDVENAHLQWKRAKELGKGSDFLDKKIMDKKLYE